jgi:WD40 repeat protein
VSRSIRILPNQSEVLMGISGHTAEINRGAFHPTDANVFLTCSNDSTLRIWEVSNRRKQKSVIVVKSKERGARTRVTACAWSPDGTMIAGGGWRFQRQTRSICGADMVACLDGTLHVWKTNSNLARPDRSCETAHIKNSETTGIAWSPDGTRLATRGGDDTVKRKSRPVRPA